LALNRKGGPWEGGGYISLGPRGQKTYVIERSIGRKRFHISTRCHTSAGAEAQLRRFEADPLNYRPEGGDETADVEPVYLTAELAAEYLDACEAKGSARSWVRTKEFYLEKWGEDLGGVDLRRASLRDHIEPALQCRQTGRAGRIITLKAFFAWLRTVKHALRSHEDCTIDLKVPQATPEKWRRRKAADIETVRAAVRLLAPAYRDVLTVLAASGWHVSELERFVRDEGSHIVYVRRPEALAVLVTVHKSGKPGRATIRDQAVLGAAERLRARREVPRRLNDAIKAACAAAGVPSFQAGSMRHSVATWAIESGMTMQEVADFLQHSDKRTTARWYADVAVPRAPALPRVLD
jgi:integrase